MNIQKLKIFIPIPVLALVFFMLSVSSIQAEQQYYESRQTIGKLLSSLIDEIDRADQKYIIKKVYDSKSDGREGMVLRFQKSGALCEFVFLPHPFNKNQSKIRIFPQDKSDASWLHELFIKKLKMKLSHVNNKPTANPWPVKVPAR